jgi:hypothetical protein
MPNRKLRAITGYVISAAIIYSLLSPASAQTWQKVAPATGAAGTWAKVGAPSSGGAVIWRKIAAPAFTPACTIIPARATSNTTQVAYFTFQSDGQTVNSDQGNITVTGKWGTPIGGAPGNDYQIAFFDEGINANGFTFTTNWGAFTYGLWLDLAVSITVAINNNHNTGYTRFIYKIRSKTSGAYFCQGNVYLMNS